MKDITNPIPLTASEQAEFAERDSRIRAYLANLVKKSEIAKLTNDHALTAQVAKELEAAERFMKDPLSERN